MSAAHARRRRSRRAQRQGSRRHPGEHQLLKLSVAFVLLLGASVMSYQFLRTSPIGSGVTAKSVDRVSITPPSTTSTTLLDRNPFADPQIQSFLDSRKGKVTAALFDVATGRTYVYHPHDRQVTASMVKIDLVAALLYKTQQEHRGLTQWEDKAARAMITASNNSMAQPVFLKVGNRDGLASFNQLLGFTETTPSWGWGLTETTPEDQLVLLKHIALPSSVLSNESQIYERSLMEHVYSSERFGIPQGVPTDATVGVKNGWYNEKDTGWQVNSAGYVHRGDTFYLACVETSNNPNEAYGMDTVSTLGRLLWSYQSAP